MKRVLVLTALLMLAAGAAFAQASASHDVTITVNSVAVIALNNTGALSFSTSGPALPGDPPAAGAPATDNSKILWYTVVTGTAGKITVQNTGAAIPAGTQLQVVATSVTDHNGAALAGSAQPTVTIDATAKDLVTAIPSCYTGRLGNGAALTYTFSVSDASQLVVGAAATATITFTITG